MADAEQQSSSDKGKTHVWRGISAGCWEAAILCCVHRMGGQGQKWKPVLLGLQEVGLAGGRDSHRAAEHQAG